MNFSFEYDEKFDFANFKNLTNLNCYFSKKTINFDLLTKLVNVRICNYDEANLEKFQKLSKIKKLELIDFNCKSLKGIEGLNRLKELKIINAKKLITIDALKFLNESLTFLELSSPTLSDLSPITNLSNLKILNIYSFNCIDDLSFLNQIKTLEELSIYHVSKINSLSFIKELKSLKKLYLPPWNVAVDDNSYLSLTIKLVELNKLHQIIEWEGIIEHLDEKGMKIFEDFFNLPKLQFIKREFNFHNNEEYLEPYTRVNCESVKSIIYNLINQLESSEGATEEKKTDFFKECVLELNVIANSIKGFIETGEREYLCDVLDEIAEAVSIDINQFEDGIASEWRSW